MQNSVWVLWHHYGDGAHIERVYLDETRAREDYELTVAVALSDAEWYLSETELFGKLNSAGKSVGGHARAASLSPERRSEIASKAAKKRWDKSTEDQP